jgi:hypothetical protein
MIHQMMENPTTPAAPLKARPQLTMISPGLLHVTAYRLCDDMLQNMLRWFLSMYAIRPHREQALGGSHIRNQVLLLPVGLERLTLSKQQQSLLQPSYQL